ncbi:hypothetical protein DINM_003279 [Dirofilaria immitis]|nr:hypothetical protein [Dirofilaria immitis]
MKTQECCGRKSGDDMSNGVLVESQASRFHCPVRDVSSYYLPWCVIANDMYGTNESSSTPTFNDDDWEAIFGTEDEIDDAKKPNQNSEPDAEKPKQSGKLDSLNEFVSTKTNAEVPTVYSRQIACSSTGTVMPDNKSEMSAVARKGKISYIRRSKPRVLCRAVMVVMDLCMKREQKLRVEGNIVEANALNTVGFSVMNLIAKVMDLLQSNECIHVGSLILEAVKVLMDKGSDDWGSLILCAESIHALVEEVRLKSAGLINVEQPKTLNKTENKLDKKEHATKQEANEKRKCRVMQRTESQIVLHSSVVHQAANYLNATNRDGSAVLMAANKFKNRIPNLPDDKRFIGPIRAEALMEGCEESDSSNSTTLPVFPAVSVTIDYNETEQMTVQRNSNHCCLQRSNSFPSSLTETPTKCCISSHIRNDVAPVIREADSPRLISNIPRQTVTSSCLSTFVEISSSSQRSQPDINSISTVNSIKAKFVVPLAQKYDNLNFAKIRKAGTKLNESAVEKSRSRKKNVRFLAESEYSVFEIPSDPNTTAEVLGIIRVPDYHKKYTRGSEEVRKKQMENLSPREYDFFLGPTISRPIGSVNARSFCESCEFVRGDICNWILSDALTHIFINVSSLKIFLAVGEDWIVKKSMMPEEFTSFIRRFAGILYELYVKEYMLEHTKEMEFMEDSGKIKTGYAYVEMPSVILFTVPSASFSSVSDSDTEVKCAFYNSAIRELVQNWDTTSRSPYYHNATKQCIELRLIDWRQICINENAISNSSMITVLMKHLMEEWGICMAPVNRP